MTGTLINSALIVVGSTAGIAFSKHSRVAESKTLIQIIGVFTLLIGFQASQTISSGGKFVLVMAAVLLGGALGEWLKMEQHAETWAKELEKKLELRRLNKGRAPRQKELLPAFVAASILYCVGPMAILGSLEDGLKQDPSLLITKGILDGTVSIAMAASLGVGVLFSAVSILLYQGALTLLAQQANTYIQPESIQAISGIGGVLLIFVGFNLVGITKVKILNLLPGILLGAIAAAFYWH